MSDLTPEEKLAALGLTLPAVPTPLANYVPYRWAGNLLFLSGQGPKRPDGTLEIGRLGKDATIEDGYRAARLTGLQLLAVAKSAVGELSRIEAVVKLLGMVNAEADFGDHPQSDQRLLGLACRNTRGGGSPCSLRRWHGLASQRHYGRDRSHSVDSTVRSAKRITAASSQQQYRDR